MRLSTVLGLAFGERVAVVGAGGKTTLVERLADEWAPYPEGVLIAPTARIGLWQQRPRPGVRYLGYPQGRKLAAAPMEDIAAAAENAALTLMEADGSRGLPLKGWAGHEPVVPPFTTITIGVISARAVGLTAVEENVHRLPLFLAQAGLGQGEPVGEDHLARMIRYCMDCSAVGRQVVFINQADTPALQQTAHRIARALDGFEGKILAGTLKEGTVWSER